MSVRIIPRCVILGAGGHARVVIDALQAIGVGVPHGVLDPDRARWDAQLLGVPILGGDELLPRLAREGVTHFVVGVGSVGDSRTRRRLFELAMRHGLIPLAVRHPSSVCSRWAKIGAGTVLLPASVVNAGAQVGVNVIVNTGAIVEHDCIIGDHAHVATGARLSGTVSIGEGAHVGAGATIRQHISVGADAVIGAGAVVIDDVESRTVVAGVPARVLQVQPAR